MRLGTHQLLHTPAGCDDGQQGAAGGAGLCGSEPGSYFCFASVQGRAGQGRAGQAGSFILPVAADCKPRRARHVPPTAAAAAVAAAAGRPAAAAGAAAVAAAAGRPASCGRSSGGGGRARTCGAALSSDGPPGRWGRQSSGCRRCKSAAQRPAGLHPAPPCRQREAR